MPILFLGAGGSAGVVSDGDAPAVVASGVVEGFFYPFVPNSGSSVLAAAREGGHAGGRGCDIFTRSRQGRVYSRELGELFGWKSIIFSLLIVWEFG